jgi:hypothetical protein
MISRKLLVVVPALFLAAPAWGMDPVRVELAVALAKAGEKAVKENNQDEMKRVRDLFNAQFEKLSKENIDKKLDDAAEVRKKNEEYSKMSDEDKKAAKELFDQLEKLVKVSKQVGAKSEAIANFQYSLYAYKVLTGQLTLWDRFWWSSMLTKGLVIGGTIAAGYVAYELYQCYYGNDESDEQSVDDMQRMYA